MRRYQLHHCDPHGAWTSSRPVDCVDDEAAYQRARQQAGRGGRIEIWLDGAVSEFWQSQFH